MSNREKDAFQNTLFTFSENDKEIHNVQQKKVYDKNKMLRNIFIVTTIVFVLLSSIYIYKYYSDGAVILDDPKPTPTLLPSGIIDYGVLMDAADYNSFSFSIEAVLEFNPNPYSTQSSSNAVDADIYINGNINVTDKKLASTGIIDLSSTTFKLNSYINSEKSFYLAPRFSNRYIYTEMESFDKSVSSSPFLMKTLYSELTENNCIINVSDDNLVIEGNNYSVKKYSFTPDYLFQNTISSDIIKKFQQDYAFYNLSSKINSMFSPADFSSRAFVYNIYIYDNNVIRAEYSANLKLSGNKSMEIDNISMFYAIDYFNINNDNAIEMPELNSSNSISSDEISNAVG